MVTLSANKNPTLSVIATGLPRIKHELNFRLKGSSTPLFSAVDVNLADNDGQDTNTRDHIDVYPIANQIQGKTGTAIFDYTIVVAKVATNVPYRVTVSVVQAGATVFAETYSNTDANAGTGRFRTEAGIEIFNVA